MSSPRGSKSLLSTPSKDSPTSNFFNNLSPINVISSRLSCQAFDNVDVPSPQPVFGTPQNRLINSKLWRRSETLFFPGSQKSCPGDADLAATSLGYPGMTREVIPMAAVQLGNGSDNKHNNDQPQDEVCRSLLNGVDDFLSIPSEDCEKTSCSPSFFLGEADDLARDKEVIPFCGNGEQMAYPKEDSVQVSAVKSAPNVTNSVAEYTKHSELVSSPNMQPNEAALPQAFQNNSTVYEGEFLISNLEKSSNFNVVDQNSSCLPEKDPAKQKSSSQIVSAAYEEIEKKRGLIGKKVEAKSNSFFNSISSTQKEPITPDMMGSNHSYDPNTMNFRSTDDCPGTSRSYMLRMHDDDFYSSSTEFLGKLGCSVETKCEMLRNTHFHTNHHGILGQMRDKSGKNQIPLDQEDLAHHSRGMYKRLQFEDVEKQEQSVAYTGNCMNLNSPQFLLDSSTIASNRKSSHASTTNTITMSGRLQTIQSLLGNISCHYLVKADSSEQSKGRFTAEVSRSSGIGLHLNAIGMTGQMSDHIGMTMQVEGLGLKGKTVVDSSCEVLSQGLNNMMVSRNGAEEVSIQLISNSGDSSFGSIGECNNEGHQKPLDIAPDYPSPLDAEPLDICMQPEFNDHHITPCNTKRLLCVEVSKSEDSAQTSIGKRRKKDPEIEGQKRCNCKRSKCLKLYCDCFAAGMFCNTTCACQGCSNNSENEETVTSTRQLIEARNPLAFAPRVVHANDDQKENADNKHITPPSSRHKRGCNCKKSKCSKKYCECYQAGVGCSLGCRCQGCKNAFGTKEAYSDVTEIIVEHQKLEDGLSGESSLEALEVAEAKSKVANNTKQINKRFTLPASLVKGTNANGVARLQLPASESNFAALSSLDSPTSTSNQTRNSAHGQKSEQPLPTIPCNQFDSCSGLNIDSLSPGWNEFTAICIVSPLSDPSPSTSRTEQDKTYKAKLLPERNISSGVSLQHCSTAIPPGLFGEGKSITNPATTGELHYNLTDETPEILKDAHSPIKTVKASSPNQKRVSPPQRMLHEAGSSFSSPGLKSGRKYVLHSIPQFPSLTPYRNNSKNRGT